MTSMLNNAFTEASKLPVFEQNALARWMLNEIESDRKWNRLFADSEEVLGELALEALEEDNNGITTKLDPDQL